VSFDFLFPGFGPPGVGFLACGSRFRPACESVEWESPGCEPFEGEELVPMCLDPGSLVIPGSSNASLPLWRGFSGECFFLPRPLDSDRSAARLRGLLLSCGAADDIVILLRVSISGSLKKCTDMVYVYMAQWNGILSRYRT